MDVMNRKEYWILNFDTSKDRTKHAWGVWDMTHQWFLPISSSQVSWASVLQIKQTTQPGPRRFISIVSMCMFRVRKKNT
ncbi:unnamed protein product [Linum trigynum]|uniref:Uncharacterized protein n=1 Tax=Linum trigynum TaxID=586398 RepID=A0AAV2DNJ4_9ROSI